MGSHHHQSIHLNLASPIPAIDIERVHQQVCNLPIFISLSHRVILIGILPRCPQGDSQPRRSDSPEPSHRFSKSNKSTYSLNESI
jgi:hypothetical protein